MSEPPIVSFKRVSHAFKDPTGNQDTALRNINLSIYPGEFVSIIGPSGCGKTTLLRIAGDLITPSEGEVLINDKAPGQARTNHDYGIVFQSATLYEWRTVLKNIELPLDIMKYPHAERTARAQEMLELVELADFANHYPRQLSGGMQQRVAIARALAFRPSILLMDEPFGALDEITRERLNNELLMIWSKTKTTVLFVTHSIHEAVYLSSRVIVMSPRPGQIVADVKIDLPYPRVMDVRDTESFLHLVSTVRSALRAEG